MDLATVCDGNRSIINASFTKILKKTEQKGQQAIKADPQVRTHFNF